jgi:hypothetical protein
MPGRKTASFWRVRRRELVRRTWRFRADAQPRRFAVNGRSGPGPAAPRPVTRLRQEGREFIKSKNADGWTVYRAENHPTRRGVKHAG